MAIIADTSTYTETGRRFNGSEFAVMHSFNDAKQKAERRRHGDAAARLSIYRDDWKEILLQRLQTMFSRENYLEIAKVVDVSNNPLKRIIEDLSNVYCEPATWTFEGDNKVWAEVFDALQPEITFPEIDRLTNLCNEVFEFVAPCDDGLKIHIITPDNLVAWADPDDPTRPIAIAYRQGFSETPSAKPRWHYWSRGEIALHEITEGDDWDPLRNKILLREDNPYVDKAGDVVIPGVMRHRAPPHDGIWDSTGGNDLEEVTILVGCLETWVNHLARTDSIALKYATGLIDPKGSPVATSLGILPIIPAGDGPVSVGQFTSNTNFDALGNLIVRKLQNTLANNGMSLADFKLTGDVQSGFALQMQRVGLIEKRKGRLPLAKAYDLELYDVIAAVWNFELTNSESPHIQGEQMPWAEDCKPSIAYADYRAPLTAQERTEEMTLSQTRLSMGLVSIVDLYRKEHPGLSEADAEKELAANIALNTRLLPANELVSGRAQVLPSEASAVAAGAAAGKGPAAQRGATPSAATADHKQALAKALLDAHAASKAKAGK